MQFSFKGALSGLVSTGIPLIFKGMVNQFLDGDDQRPPVSIKEAVSWVTEEKDLLTLFQEYGGDDFDNVLARATNFIQDGSWLTTEWLIDACRDEHPDIASLFLGWNDGRAWLDVQTENLRQAFSKTVEKMEEPPEEKPAAEKTVAPSKETVTSTSDALPSLPGVEKLDPGTKCLSKLV